MWAARVSPAAIAVLAASSMPSTRLRILAPTNPIRAIFVFCSIGVPRKVSRGTKSCMSRSRSITITHRPMLPASPLPDRPARRSVRRGDEIFAPGLALCLAVRKPLCPCHGPAGGTGRKAAGVKRASNASAPRRNAPMRPRSASRRFRKASVSASLGLVSRNQNSTVAP